MIPTFKILIAIAILTAFSGCSTTPSELELNYGKAYRNMVAEQIYDTNAATNPPSNPPENLDGERASALLNEYRVDSDKQPQAPAISIKLGK